MAASTLLGSDPPRQPTWALVRSGEAFGITTGATRTALSRMSAAGEIEPDGDGYRLAGPDLLARLARQESGRRGGHRGKWDGTWELAVVASGARPASARASLRDAARDLRLVELREGLWGRPSNLDSPAVRAPAAAGVMDEQCSWWTGARPGGPLEDLWGLAEWAATAGDLVSLLADIDPTDLAPAFTASAAVLRHLQADPLLPPPLLPAGWPGDDLRRRYATFDPRFRRAWSTWIRAARP